MNKNDFLTLLLVPLFLLLIASSATYIYWGMEIESNESANTIPNIDQLINRIQNEKGETSKDKLLSFTNTFREILVSKYQNQAESNKSYKNLLQLIIASSISWVLLILYIYRKSNKTP